MSFGISGMMLASNKSEVLSVLTLKRKNAGLQKEKRLGYYKKFACAEEIQSLVC